MIWSSLQIDVFTLGFFSRYRQKAFRLEANFIFSRCLLFITCLGFFKVVSVSFEKLQVLNNVICNFKILCGIYVRLPHCGCGYGCGCGAVAVEKSNRIAGCGNFTCFLSMHMLFVKFAMDYFKFFIFAQVSNG